MLLRQEPRTLLRWALAALTAVAVVVQLSYSLAVGGASAWNFFSFFTIESNLLVIAALLVPQASVFRGAVTLYITITGVVYALLLSGLEASLQTQIPWVNTTLHYITPALMLLDWIVEPAMLALPVAQLVARWLVYPIVYLGYSLVRGALVGWYPYPFLNPKNGGYGAVATVSVIIAGCAALVAAALALYAKLRHRAHA